jgi:hypothetical protein
MSFSAIPAPIPSSLKPEITIKSPNQSDFIYSFSDGLLKGFFVVIGVSIAAWVVTAVLRGDSSDSRIPSLFSRSTTATNSGPQATALAARSNYLRNVHTLDSINNFN